MPHSLSILRLRARNAATGTPVPCCTRVPELRQSTQAEKSASVGNPASDNPASLGPLREGCRFVSATGRPANPCDPSSPQHQEKPLKLHAAYEIHCDEYVVIRFSQEVPHFPRAPGIRSRCSNNELLSRVTELPVLAEHMAGVNARCFRVERNPLDRCYEDFLRDLVTVDGFECVTDCGRYFFAIKKSPLHPVEDLCEAVVRLVKKYFYPDWHVQLTQPEALHPEASDGDAPTLNHS